MKILHLEDNPHDAELTALLFTEEWPDCEINLVATRDEFVARLEAGGLDLILSDFNLSSFDGLEALQLAHDRLPAVPFIFLSGTIGEDRAVDALRSGASDYVIKDRPKRLLPAVRRALDDSRLQRERKAAEEQLLRVQRLENIGMLAAGIAHDFNNVLAPVLMAVPLLRDRLSESSDQQILSSIEKSVQRGAGLVRQILGFARGVTGEAHLVQSKHLLHELVGVMQQTFPRSIQIEQDIESQLWPLKVNPTQLHQVLLNLCVNARDAMPNGGTLHLTAGNLQLDEMGASALPGAHPGLYVKFEVTDTGTGIPADVLPRIWEPFFTTKETGRGTGLGLPTVRSIVESQKGIVTVQSRAGQGSTFQVLLPATPTADLAPNTPVHSAIPRGQGELILVVDDDTQVRDITTTMLSRHGYRVIAAANGTEGVALFAPRSLEIRIVVTDLSMPELDGFALVKVVRNLNPSTRVLTMSGMSDATARLQRQHLDAPLLAKPFTSEALLSKIHELILSSPAGASARRP